MQLPSFWRLLAGFALVHIFAVSSAAQTNYLYQQITEYQQAAVEFTPFAPFSVLHSKNQAALAIAPKAQFLTLNDAVLTAICQQRPDAVSLSIPYHGVQLEVDLFRVDVTSADFTLLTDRDPGAPLPADLGVHYRGVLRGDPHAVAALSFFDHEMMGMIASDDGNLVLGKIQERDNHYQYVLYSDAEMAVPNPFQCHAPEPDFPTIKLDENAVTEVNKCVRVYLESDHELFQEKGNSVENTVNYLLGMFNQVATLYANEQINTVVSQLFVWTTPDIYTTTNSATVLDQFRNFRTSFNADLAHLVGTGGNNLGGIAYVDVLCVNGFKVAFSDITATYSNVPTYSWTVEVVTHEMGHNLGSRHTQWCGWPGGPIDNCVPAEGNCNPGPPPVNGGTIMSYCHLTGNGINFNNGFGPLPGNTIRTAVGNAACLATSCPAAGSCAAPSAFTVTNITGSGATVGWNAVSGATAYVLRYRAVGAAQWTTVNNAPNPSVLTGLPVNEEIEVTVQSLCGSANSDFKNGVLFKTGASGGGSGACAIPSGISVVPAANSAAVSWAIVAGANSYQIQWKTAAASAWGALVTVAGTSYTIANLQASTAYELRVAAVCSSGNSGFAQQTFTTASGGGATCPTPANVSAVPTQNSAQINWSTVSGANGYAIQWKLTTSNTWSNTVNVATNTHQITGLSAATAYNVRVASICPNGNSAFTTTTFTTTGNTACGMPSGLNVQPTAGSALVAWTGVNGAVYYELQWKLVTSGVWNTAVNVSGLNYQIGGLLPSTSYNVRVRAVCGNGASAYASGIFTTTSGGTPCNAPTNLSVTPATTSAAVAWTGVNGANTYQLQWKTAAASTWSAAVNLAATAYTITGLAAGTQYQVRVQAVCSGAGSVFAQTNFTTQAAGGSCNPPSGVTFSNVTPFSAAISWPATQGAISYTFRIKSANSTNWFTFHNLPITVVTVQNLIPSTTYQVQVRTHCSGGAVSAFSPTHTFTTPAQLGELPANDREQDLVIRRAAAVAPLVTPNPSAGTGRIWLPDLDNQEVQYTVLNQFGQVVQQQKEIFTDGGLDIDLSDQAAGLYWVQLRTEQWQSKPLRWVITR